MARRRWHGGGLLGLFVLACLLAGCAKEVPITSGAAAGDQSTVSTGSMGTADQPSTEPSGRLDERDRSATEGRMSSNRGVADPAAAREAFLNTDVLFTYNSFTLTEEAKELLEQKAQWMVQHPEVTVQLEESLLAIRQCTVELSRCPSQKHLVDAELRLDKPIKVRGHNAPVGDHSDLSQDWQRREPRSQRKHAIERFGEPRLTQRFKEMLGCILELLGKLSAERPASLAGDTDSEVLFALVLDQLDAGASPVEASRILVDVGERYGGRYNVVFWHPDGVVATRWDNSLYLSTERGSIVSSEPIGDRSWTPVPERTVVAIDEHGIRQEDW